ncbi:class I SAM-dependent methyltransferase [Gilvimarinus algae]|uniref:Class I SAM-dependent methyltransferase n=1 Tax=Gilvimarinus algae TaxID=3058037 RepID=A0ABT8TDM1_9GAMM|nr:class I SAM-dependent methyltransferase [Gilvimarinus sp. SDUM040014]MDO3382026.1 class I SAM-dependent methyltransferase [Gilvimarinus sp. SDUM040014]
MSHHHFAQPEVLIDRLEPPDRDAWQKPDAVIRALGLPADAVVAELGAGTGYFALHLAQALPEGRVLALDSQPAMVRYLAERARVQGVSNLEALVIAHKGFEEDIGAVNLLLLVDAYHHIPNRVEYFGRVARRLASGTRLAVIDRRQSEDDIAAGRPRVVEAVVIVELAQAGFGLLQRFDFLPRQYFLVFERL